MTATGLKLVLLGKTLLDCYQQNQDKLHGFREPKHNTAAQMNAGGEKQNKMRNENLNSVFLDTARCFVILYF